MYHAATTDGYCVDCAITALILSVDGLRWATEGDATLLLEPLVQEPIESLLQPQFGDAQPGQINWQRVVDLWALPVDDDPRQNTKEDGDEC